MTDNEIIKALENCANDEIIFCGGIDCPLHGICAKDTNALEKYALDLINRLKADNKKLENIERLADKTIATLTAEIENLRNIVKTDLLNAKYDFKLSLSDIAEIRAEAIKEFWAKVKEEKITHRNLGEIIYVEIGDEVLKEMVGDSDA